jgi:hypothetical protein
LQEISKDAMSLVRRNGKDVVAEEVAKTLEEVAKHLPKDVVEKIAKDISEGKDGREELAKHVDKDILDKADKHIRKQYHEMKRLRQMEKALLEEKKKANRGVVGLRIDCRTSNVVSLGSGQRNPV